MASKFRIFTRRFFIFANTIVVIVFLLSCLAPFLNPQKWWIITFMGLAFPFLLVIVIFFFAGWLIILKPRLALISGIALLLSYKSISVFLLLIARVDLSIKKNPAAYG